MTEAEWLASEDPTAMLRSLSVNASERKLRLSAFRADQPLPGSIASAQPLDARIVAAGFKLGAPIFVRVYKRTFELEVWM